MKVLVTGATGYIGGATAEAMQAAGHDVLALAHTEEVAMLVEQRGWRAARGDLRDTAALESHARSADAVVHAANTGGADAAEVDTVATRALLAGLAGSGRPFVYTSGIWVLGAGAGDEGSATDAPSLVGWRAGLEVEVLGAGPGLRAVVLRPAIAYGRGGGIPGMVFRGEIPVIGDGTQRWPLVHLEDLADLYVRALGAPAGAILHGAAHSLSMREIAVIGAAAHGVELQQVTVEDAVARFGAFAEALSLSQQVSSRKTRQLSGWRPVSPSPVEDLVAGSYAVAAAQRAA